MTLTNAEAAKRWRAAKHLMARALAQLAELDEETNGPQQFAACILATETDKLDKLLANAVQDFADSAPGFDPRNTPGGGRWCKPHNAMNCSLCWCQGCGGSGKTHGSLTKCTWCGGSGAGLPTTKDQAG